MKKNKFITIGVCAAVLANIVATPAIALAETVTEQTAETTETVQEAPVAEAPVAEEPVIKEPVIETPVAEEPVAEKPVEEVIEKPVTPVEEKPQVKPEVKPAKPEVEVEKPAENKTLTQSEKEAFMSKSTLEFQGMTYTYSEFLTFTDSLKKENYTAVTFDKMVAARLAFRQALGAASTDADLPKVKAAADAFVAAVNGLRSPSKSSSKKLEAAINAVNWSTLVKADYTEVSWNNLASVYKVAISTFEASKTQNIYQEQLDSLADSLNAANKALRKKVTATQTVNVNVDLTGDQSYVNAPYKVSQVIGDGITIQIWDMAAQATNNYNYVLYVDGVVAISGVGSFDQGLTISADQINNGQDASNGYGDELREVKTNVNLSVKNSRTPNAVDLTHTFNFDRYDYGTVQSFSVDGGSSPVASYSFVSAEYTEQGVILKYSENGEILDVQTLVDTKNSSYTFNYMSNGTLGRLTVNITFNPIGGVDKTTLEDLLYLITTTIDPDDYTPNSVMDLVTAYNNALAVLNNSTATLSDVTFAETALKEAINKLVLKNPQVNEGKLNTVELIKQITIANSKEEALYTSASWLNMTKALEVAETVLRYSDFKNIENGHNARAAKVDINVTQKMIANATANLQKAISELTLVDTGSKPGTPTPIKPGKPGTPGGNDKVLLTTKKVKVVKGKRLTQTNVSLGAMPALGGLSAAMGSIVAFVKGRKNRK